MTENDTIRSDLNAQLDDAKQKIQDLQADLSATSLQNADLKAKNLDIKKRRTADRKEWKAEQARGYGYQSEVRILRSQIGAKEQERCRDESDYTATRPIKSNDKFPILIIDEKDQNIELLRLENKKLRSRQLLLINTMNENDALHEDRLQKAKQIGDLMNELESAANNGPEKDHTIEELQRKCVKLAEHAERQKEFTLYERKCTLNETTKVEALRKEITQHKAELEEHRYETQQQESRKRKLTAFLKDMGLTKDDFGANDPLATKTTDMCHEAVALAGNDTSKGMRSAQAQLVVQKPSSANDQPSDKNQRLQSKTEGQKQDSNVSDIMSESTGTSASAGLIYYASELATGQAMRPETPVLQRYTARRAKREG